jgi:hypothetical protein
MYILYSFGRAAFLSAKLLTSIEKTPTIISYYTCTLNIIRVHTQSCRIISVLLIPDTTSLLHKQLATSQLSYLVSHVAVIFFTLFFNRDKKVFSIFPIATLN